MKSIRDLIAGKPTDSRSPHWPGVRKVHLADHPQCAVCGGIAKLEVHHIYPFHLFPLRELDPTNLITLCEAWKFGVNCHLFFGHFGDYARRWNSNVIADAAAWKYRVDFYCTLV